VGRQHAVALLHLAPGAGGWRRPPPPVGSRSSPEHGWDADDVVNPQDPAAFTGAKLRWSERDDPEHAEILAIYRQLLRLRREQPDLADSRLNLVEVDFDEDAQWIIVHRGAFDVLANLADHAQPLPAPPGNVLFSTEPRSPSGLSGGACQTPPDHPASTVGRHHPPALRIRVHWPGPTSGPAQRPTADVPQPTG